MSMIKLDMKNYNMTLTGRQISALSSDKIDKKLNFLILRLENAFKSKQKQLMRR